MANSLISGLIASGHSAQQNWVADADQQKLSSLATSMHVNTSATNDALIAEVDVVVLAVKPQAIAAVIKESIASFKLANVLIVSIAAGINQHSLSQWLGADKAIVRCMPNTPALVQTGATGLHANQNVSDEAADKIIEYLKAKSDQVMKERSISRRSSSYVRQTVYLLSISGVYLNDDYVLF